MEKAERWSEWKQKENEGAEAKICESTVEGIGWNAKEGKLDNWKSSREKKWKIW
jgi:hypothetical protein